MRKKQYPTKAPVASVQISNISKNKLKNSTDKKNQIICLSIIGFFLF